MRLYYAELAAGKKIKMLKEALMINSIPHLERNDAMTGMHYLLPNVVYTTETGEELKMMLILPWAQRFPEMKHEKHPLLVFVQGSAWKTADFNYQLPQLCQFARETGFVVATVRHRDCTHGHPFPAFLQDVKCAIRYLRKNADEYGIDPERVAFWGTSSGGNTAMLIGSTIGDERYETAEHAGYSDKVNCVVSCFGPSDMPTLAAPLIETNEGKMMGYALCGSADPEVFHKAAIEMSPVSHISADRSYPPFLLLNGTADPVVPYNQMEIMYEKLVECGVSAEAYYIDGAIHEDNFWSQEVLDIIRGFIVKNT
ncbi:MAG: alpha/beta hydrolase [Oscillospiraceae bacterium]|nr:alpha/beta hydrolase [Oscillospiraceae bacterium]